MGLLSRVIACTIAGSIAYASCHTRVWTLDNKESKASYSHLKDMLRSEIEYSQRSTRSTSYPKEIQTYMNVVLPSSERTVARVPVTLKSSWNNGVDKVFNYLSRL